MSLKKKSLLNVARLEFDIYFNKQLISLDYDDQTTVGDVLEQISKKFNLRMTDISLYLAKKSGDPKLSFPTLERDRQLIRTNEKRFVIVEHQRETTKIVEIPQRSQEVTREVEKKNKNIFSLLFGIKSTGK